MDGIAVGRKVPPFTLAATGAQEISLDSLRGKNLVLYFYPRDNTPGCTTEGQEFRDHHLEFATLNTVILGVSRDSLASHERFKEKQALPFDLLSDSAGELCQRFTVIKEKNMYGKKVLGIERSTFLIDGNGVLHAAWRKVKVAGHIDEVLNAIKRLEQ